MDTGKTFYINGMKLEHYLWYLQSKRLFNIEKMIEYTNEIYSIDLTDIIGDNLCFYTYSYDIRKEFLKENILQIKDDGTREFFNKYARKQYVEFIEEYYCEKEDGLTHHQKYEEVHHIFPLIYGGMNNLENLIHLSGFNHDLLHENPLEEDSIECYKALDYLGHLYTEGRTYEIIEEYELYKYSDQMFPDMYAATLKEEMRKYYHTRNK